MVYDVKVIAKDKFISFERSKCYKLERKIKIILKVIQSNSNIKLSGSNLMQPASINLILMITICLKNKTENNST